ncbi:MAG: universal stress protein [Alloalcanivorax venustensis]
MHAVLVLAERLQRQAGVVDGGEVQVRDTAAVVAQHHAVVPLEAGAAGGVRGQRDGLHPGGAARLDGDPAVVEIADLIVLGSHGKHGIRLLLGSTANAVLHRATCDVLAVRIPE